MTRRQLAASSPTAEAVVDRAVAAGWTLDRVEREVILSTLAATEGRREEAARRLGVNRRTIYRKLRRYRDEGWVE